MIWWPNVALGRGCALNPGAKSAKTARREAPGKEPGVPHFSAQLALVTARPPLKNPRMALGYRIFRAEHVWGPPRLKRIEAEWRYWPFICYDGGNDIAFTTCEASY